MNNKRGLHDVSHDIIFVVTGGCINKTKCSKLSAVVFLITSTNQMLDETPGTSSIHLD